MTSTPEQVIAKIREALEYACNNEGTSSLISEFLLVRDQQTTQDERDEGERETSAFYIAQMVRRDSMKAVRDKVRPLLEAAEAERDALRHDIERYVAIAAELANSPAALQSAADTPVPQEHLAGTPEVEHMRQKAISNARERNAALRAIQAALDDFELIVDRINAGQINRACATAMQGAKEDKLALAASAREDGR